MRLITIVCCIGANALTAQWQVPVPVVLDGPQPEQRQVIGLEDPVSSSSGVSVDAARALATSFAQVTGTAVLTATLTPAPMGYAAGMVVPIMPAQANAPNASLDLNGLGPVPIVKLGGLPLDSADLTVDAPHRLVYDGSSFHLLTAATRPCPAGYQVGSREFCIADSSQEALDFLDAGTACRDANARLCTWSEWVHACLSKPGFIGSVLDFEWVDHAANNTSNAKRVGRGSDGSSAEDLGIGCIHGHHTLPTNPTRFRCCTSR